jgi:SAM-dependent methyltransferase
VPPDRPAAAVVRAEVDHGDAELVAEPDRPWAWTLLVNGTAQSHVDLAEPTHLEFEYVRRIAHVLDALDPPAPGPVRVLHLGGGAWTLPRYVAATRPGSLQTVVELDGALVDLVRGRLPADGLGLDVRVDDARSAVVSLPPAAYDALVVDVFAGARIPAHLTSVEFLRAAARVLRPGGTYFANLADAAPLPFVRAQVATAAAVFAEVALVAAPEVLHGRRFGNLVLLAGTDLPLGELARAAAGDPFPARVVAGADLARLVGDVAPTTDATAVPSPLPPPGFFGQ